MTNRKYIYTLISLYLCSVFCVTSADEECDKSKCKGPLKFYEDSLCTPIYGTGDNCCPIEYDCKNLMGRSYDKCYFKGEVYEIGQKLKAEHAKPCDIDCSCQEGWHDAASFSCAAVDCFAQAGPGCYLKATHDCCEEDEVCPDRDPEVARCEVDGKTYLDGQRFTPKSDQNQSCICSAGYAGENVPPFCKPVVPWTCDAELHFPTDVYNNCTPAFYSTQNPATDCHIFSRCQNSNDRILKTEDAAKTEVTPVPDTGTPCIFGNMTMKRGEELNSGTHYSSVCLKCLCEVPPIPTCKRLPETECDVTVHEKFDDFSK